MRVELVYDLMTILPEELLDLAVVVLGNCLGYLANRRKRLFDVVLSNTIRFEDVCYGFHTRVVRIDHTVIHYRYSCQVFDLQQV